MALAMLTTPTIASAHLKTGDHRSLNNAQNKTRRHGESLTCRRPIEARKPGLYVAVNLSSMPNCEICYLLYSVIDRMDNPIITDLDPIVDASFQSYGLHGSRIVGQCLQSRCYAAHNV